MLYTQQSLFERPSLTKSYSLYTDGASRGNPGHASIGIVIKEMGTQYTTEHGFYLDQATNNQAEYCALLAALHLIHERERDAGVKIHITAHADSQLMVRQLTGEYKIKDPILQCLHKEIMQLASGYTMRYVHVLRAQNAQADALANKALDARGPRLAFLTQIRQRCNF